MIAVADIDWRQHPEPEDPDDEQLERTPGDIVDVLGFDPAEEPEEPVEAEAAPVRNANTRHAARSVLRLAQGQSVGNWISEQCVERLAQLETQIISELKAKDPTAPGADVEKMFASVGKRINTTFSKLAKDVRGWFSNYLKISAAQAARDVAAHHGVKVGALKLPKAATVPVLGATIDEHFAKLAADALFRFKTVVRQGLVAEDSLARLVQRVEGLDEEGNVPVKSSSPSIHAIGFELTPGGLADAALTDSIQKRLMVALRLMDSSENSIDKVIQAAITTFSKEADLAGGGAAEDGGDEEEPKQLGWTWIAVLDNRTCEKCEYLDGKQWTADFEPIDDAPDWEAIGDPPVHFNCRCSIVPTDNDADPVEALDFDSYLSQYSRSEQEAAFGKGNLRAYRRGDMTAGALIGQRSNLMSLADYAKANDYGDEATQAGDGKEGQT